MRDARRFLSRCLPFLAALSCAVAARAGIPSRLVAKPPSGGALSWTFPFAGWKYEVQSQETFGGPWLTAPNGAGLDATQWLETRPGAEAGRLYRVVATPPAGERGRLVSVAKVSSYDALTLTFFFAAQNIPVTPSNGVDVYKLEYETIDAYGAPAYVSGELAFPSGTGLRAAPLLAYAHGTTLLRTDVPSNPSNGEGLLAIVIASTGYACVLPDYLGLGESKLVHPYHHAASEATCMVDGMRAARAAAAQKSVALSGKVFLCGYSQGGHVALATLRELEQRHAAEFPVTACAAMAGAYDLSGVTLADALSDRVPPSRSYLPYLMKMLVEYYRVAPSLASLLREPYATTVPPLLDGTHDDGEVDAAMPAVPNQALKPEVLAALKSDPNHPVRAALRDNDLTGWRPVSPLRLLQCSGDLDVVPANAAVALQAFHALGAAQVDFQDPKPGADHSDCVEPALLAAKAWFDTKR